jgi:predicted amidohydrolase
MIVDPHGVIVADGGKEEGLVVADVDLTKVLQWRKEFPVLQDTRIVVG